MTSRKALSNKTAADSLSLVEKYSFRGRRKYNNDTLSENNVVKKKSKSEPEKKSVDVKQEDSSSKSDNSLQNITRKGKSKAIQNKNIEENEFEIKKEPIDIIDGDGMVDVKQEVSPNVISKKANSKVIKSERIEDNKLAIKKEPNDVDIEDFDVIVNSNKVDEERVKWVPENWEEILDNIRKMRIDASAPVDDMGCHKTMDDNASPKDKRYQALVSLMLSSQTRDQMTFATMLKLREHGLNVDNILRTDEKTLSELIKSVGFYKTKAKHIKLTTQILKDEYDGDIPDTVEKMLKLPGVGPKMAHLCMTTAWGKVHGIGVDTHVHRISNRLKWVPKPTKTPEQTRIALERWLPHALWYEINHLMVGFGQQICLPIRPKCGNCLNNKICPFGISELKNRKKKTSSKK